MRKVSTVTTPINLDGMFVPFYHNDQPVLVVIEDVLFVPVFSTTEKLQEQLPTIRPHGPTKIKQIDPGGTLSFVESIQESQIRIMLDPYTIEGNKTRWTEIEMKKLP